MQRLILDVPDDAVEDVVMALEDIRDLGARDIAWSRDDEGSYATADERERASQRYASDDVEIDDDARASRADDGLWVSAWVWLGD